GALHSLYKPVPGKFKDYIAIPKVNGYQSLHTTLIGPYGMPVEVQIRTQAMNRIADAGVASHWLYKSSDAEINEVQQRTHKWLQSLLDIQHTSGDPAEFLEHIKVDLFPDEVYVFTPKGKILAMPRGATPVRWETLGRDLGAKSRQEGAADIGLGKRLAAIVARKLLSLTEPQAEGKGPAGSIVIHGSEGLAVQFAKCCNPIPGDPIVGFIKKGQGLVVHTHDCPTAAKSRGGPEKWLDVQWAPEPDKMFDVGIRVAVADTR